MTRDAIETPHAASQHNSPRVAIESSSARIVICFLVSLLGVWSKPKLEQCAKLQKCPVKGDSILAATTGRHREESPLNRGGLSAKSNKGTGISQELSYGDLMEAACHCGYDLKPKRCISDNGATITSSDRRTSGAGLNLHFFKAILLSTNKLTPEKT